MIRPFPFRFVGAVLCVSAFLLLPMRLDAQGGGAADLSNQANAAFDAGNYKAAAAAYEQLLKAFPSSEFATDARFHLAYADFLIGQSAPAADLLRKLIAAQTTPPELIEQSMLLLPQTLAQVAAKLNPDDASRLAAFQTAIKEYDNYSAKYPKNAGMENALYGRAVSEYQVANYDAALKDLRQGMTSYPKGDSYLDTEFLLAITLATRGNLALGKENHTPAEAAAAFKDFADAEAGFSDIINRRTDLSLANDAQFQLGETLLAHAAESPSAAQGALYRQALTAYRAVEPKGPMLAAQDARVARIRESLLAERRKNIPGNPNVRALNDLLARESSKSASLRAKEDTVLSARVKSGAVFYSLHRYDETRVLMNALAPEAAKPADEKFVLFYIALTYTAQDLVASAVQAYDKFQSKYAGDPIAENLPVAVAGLFQSGSHADPVKAQQYLADLAKYYPKSRLREMALLQQAEALADQEKYDEALKTLDTFMAGKPKPEYAAIADLSRGRILRDKKDYDGSLAAYKKVRDTYKGMPQAEEAAFWVAWVDLKKKDFAGAQAEVKSFNSQFPDSKLLPNALSVQAQAQDGAGDKNGALATLADLAKRFESTPEAAASYFERANILIGEKRYDEMKQALLDFVEKYPQNERVYSAYERIASVQNREGHPDEAAATYETFLSKNADSPRVPEALVALADTWKKAARQLGNFISLGAPQQEIWKADVEKSVSVSERQLDKFPEAPATAIGLGNLLECERMLVEARVKTPAEVTQYFQSLADKYKDKPAARSRILFRLATLTAVKDPARALADMRSAYDPKIIYSPADLDQYGSALLQDDPAAAADVFEKAARDYPIPAGLTPAQVPADIAHAQALALYGRAKLASSKGDEAAATNLYGQLKKDYPTSPKVPEANLALAESALVAKKPDDAIALLNDVAHAQGATPEMKAHALFLNGVAQEAKGLAGALDSYLKVAAFYASSKDAPEGLWKGAQLLEKQAPSLPDPNAKAQQLARARKAYQELVTRYPSAQWVAQARERVAALPAPTPSK